MIRLPLKTAALVAGVAMTLACQAQQPAPRTLELDGQRYTVERKDEPLASDDGMVHAYALRPAQGGKPLAVEVSYGTY